MLIFATVLFTCAFGVQCTMVENVGFKKEPNTIYNNIPSVPDHTVPSLEYQPRVSDEDMGKIDSKALDDGETQGATFSGSGINRNTQEEEMGPESKATVVIFSSTKTKSGPAYPPYYYSYELYSDPVTSPGPIVRTRRQSREKQVTSSEEFNSTEDLRSFRDKVNVQY